MLRFNNQPIPKPVDFYRPLSVDVSVEYELPKEVAPPPGSAPLLIIHPSAYVRNKKEKDLNSLLYLRAALPQQSCSRPEQPRYSSVQNPLFHRSDRRTGSSVCPYGKCDECYTSGSSGSSAGSARGKKPGGGRNLNNSSSLRDLIPRLGLPNPAFLNNNPTTTTTTNSKRLRMSNVAEPLNLAFGTSAGQLAALALNKGPYANYTDQAFDFAQLRIPSLRVEKGSGSDSGVCSENDSDVSPPMIGTLGRRSVISQELTSAGCYCCCCPPTGIRKGSGGGKKWGGGFGREQDLDSNYRKWILGMSEVGQNPALGRWFQV